MDWSSREHSRPPGRPNIPIIRTVPFSNTFAFTPNWLGNFTFGVSYLHGNAERNGYLGFAMAFPFSSTSQTISGFETYGDNQFVTPITAFPSRAQPGEVPVSLRGQRFDRPARSQVWGGLHS